MSTLIHQKRLTLVLPNHQGGNVMLISLALLAAVTLLGVAAMQGSVQEERIAGNQIERHRAMEAAQSALEAGIYHVTASNTKPSSLDIGYIDLTNPGTVPPSLENWVIPGNTYSPTRGASDSYSINTIAPVWNGTPLPGYRIEIFASSPRTVDHGGTIPWQTANQARQYRVYGHGYGQNTNSAIATVEAVVIEQ